jgi:hypothetical protein
MEVAGSVFGVMRAWGYEAEYIRLIRGAGGVVMESWY